MIITLLDWMLVILILIFGARISYTDFKRNKIYNKDLLLLLIFSLIIICIQDVIFFMNYGKIFLLPKHVLRGILGISIGFLFWIMGLWAPADGKLFGVLSFVIPGRFLVITNNSEMLSLLSNILVLISIAIIIPNITKLDKKDLNQIKKILNPKSIGFSLIGVFGLLWILQWIMSLLRINGNIILTAIILTFIIGFFRVVFKLKFKVLIFLLFFLRLFLDFPNYLSLQEIFKMLKVFVVYILLRMIILEGIFNKNIAYKKVDELKIGDYLAMVPVKENGKINLKRINFFSLFNYLSTALGFEEYEIIGNYDQSIGLESENVEVIKKIFKEKGTTEVPVFKTMPFAPYIVLGFVIAIICKGDGFILLGIFIKTILWKIGLLKI